MEQDVGRRIRELEGELTEARQQQTATAEILRVIRGSPTDIQRAFDTIARSASHLCGAFDVIVMRVDEDVLRVVAHYGPLPAGNITLHRGTLAGRAVIERRVIQIEDLQVEVHEFPEGSALARQRGIRTVLSVPLLKDDAAIGSIQVRRNEVRPFSDQQIGLLQTFADQAMIAIENTRLLDEVQGRTRELVESFEQQTATSEVLQVISSSPGELEPVFQAMLANAMQICEAKFGIMWEFADGAFRAQSTRGVPQVFADYVQQRRVWGPDTGLGQLALTKRLVRLDDTREGRAYAAGDPGRVAAVAIGGVRTFVCVPMLKEGDLIGAISLYRTEVRPFTDKQIELFANFARQAVIAIENTRLLNELRESLQQQTATAEVLNVISRSKFDRQPVFDAIVASGLKLFSGDAVLITLPEGDLIKAAAVAASDPVRSDTIRNRFPVPLTRDYMHGIAILDQRVIDIPDATNAPPELIAGAAAMLPSGNRAITIVPLMHGESAIGALSVLRLVPGSLTPNQFGLLETFADQAVIAIENTRLFEEVQARNRELRVALEQQTATSELLKVIGRSAFDLQPVFETLAENAVRLCEAERSFIFRFDGQLLRVVATHNSSAEMRAFVEQNPQAPGRGSATARAALERRTIHIIDVQADTEYTYKSRQVDPFRTILTVPILRLNELLGVIVIYRNEVRAFTDGQIALLETFADQAGIAIENTQLVQEVQARNRDLTALGEVGRAVGSTLDLKVVLKTIVDRAVELSATDAGSIFYLREQVGRFELGETAGIEEEVIARYRRLDIARSETGLGEVIANRQPLQVADLTKRASNPLRDAALEAGMRAVLAVPLLGSDGPLGALRLQRRTHGEFPEAIVSLMQAFANQSAIALENARLFEEIAQKSRELEIASQHKSQFVANMSHELRTPLAAILGYAELMQEGFYGDQSEKSLDALTRIRSNGKHLLGLINTVLDIAKIESGQFSLNLGEYALENVVETVRAATESLAAAKNLALTTNVAERMPLGLGDEQRLTQVLLNLVGNALKFTDTGEVRIVAVTANGGFVVSVTDTGPGIPPEEQTRIFEEFHQVDNSNTKAKGGTGLGLAIAKQIVEMHGGRIWVESAPGKGSTFQVELPIRAHNDEAT